MPKIIGKYMRLRRRLRDCDISQEYLAELLNCSSSHVSLCLSGHTDWKMSEVYKIAEFCRIPAAEIYVYFPPGGDDDKVAKDENSDTAQVLANAFANFMRDCLQQKGGAI